MLWRKKKAAEQQLFAAAANEVKPKHTFEVSVFYGKQGVTNKHLMEFEGTTERDAIQRAINDLMTWYPQYTKILITGQGQKAIISKEAI